MTKPASNNQIKEWRKLRMGKYRNRNRLFLAEGVRCVEQILRNKKVEVLEVLSDGSEAPGEVGIPDELPVYELNGQDYSEISDMETSQGVLAICRIPDEISVDSITKKEGLIVALDAIQDPGNLGTMIRTAAWFGVSGLIFGTGCVDPFHPKVVRSTAGATGTIPYRRGALPETLDELERMGWQVYLLDGSEGSQNIDGIHPEKNSVLVTGNEANGINAKLFAPNRRAVRIEGDPRRVESLNAAVALSIGLYAFSGG